MSVPHPKGGGGELFGLALMIISSTKRSNTNLLDFLGLIVNYLRKRRVGGLERY